MNCNKSVSILIGIIIILGVFFSTISCGRQLKTEYGKSTGKIIVEITELRSNDGLVLVALYNNLNGFPGTPGKNSIIMSSKKTISNNISIVEFNDVPYGEYVIAVIHDENNNGNMDLGMYGIPKEGSAFSNNIIAKLGPPAFKDTKFDLKSAETRQTIRMVYYN